MDSNRIVAKKVVSNSKAESRAIRLDDLRIKAKTADYHKKYGKFIVPAFAKLLAEKMRQEFFNKLVEVKKVKPAEFVDAFAKVLLMEAPSLYIKSTSNKELKVTYFAEFRKELVKWQPKKAQIKD